MQPRTRWYAVMLWSSRSLRPAASSARPFPRISWRVVSSAAGGTANERLVTLITSALTSSYFRYRTEIGTGAVAEDGTRALTEYEIATRLSFLVGESGPDEALLAAAQAGDLSSAKGRLRQLDRLLTGAPAGMHGFVLDWMGLVDPDSSIDQKNPDVLSETPTDLSARAEESLARTIDQVLEREGSLLALLSTKEVVVDSAVAGLLGLSAESSTFENATLDTATRQGILLHPAVLSAHTAEGGAAPFPVGKFIYEHVLCGTLGPIPMLPAVDEQALADLTLREYLDQTTAPAACQSCHQHIGPPGYAFLSFDPLGRYVEADVRGRPFDTRGELTLKDSTLKFEGAADMSRQLAAHPDTARCVARRLFRWTYGHFEADEDQTHLASLEEVSVSKLGSVRALLTAIVSSKSFVRVRVQP